MVSDAGSYAPVPVRPHRARPEGAPARPSRRRAAPGDDHRAGGRPTATRDCPPPIPTSCARWFVEAASSGSLERYLETFAHTVGVTQTADAPAARGPRVRARTSPPTRRLRRGALRPRAAHRAGPDRAPDRRGGARRLRRGSAQRRGGGPPDPHRRAAHGHAHRHALTADRRAGRRVPRPRRGRLRHRRRRGGLPARPGTSTPSSTCVARTRTSRSTRARRSACRASGRRCSGAVPTGSATACASSTTSRSRPTASRTSAAWRPTCATAGSRWRCARRRTSRRGRPRASSGTPSACCAASASASPSTPTTGSCRTRR